MRRSELMKRDELMKADLLIHNARDSATANTSRNEALSACSVAPPRATACLVISSSGSARAAVFGNHILTDSCLLLQQTGLAPVRAGLVRQIGHAVWL